MPETEATPQAIEAGRVLFAQAWTFVLSAPRLDVLPPADRPEVAFAGRSNVGKSSLINAVIGIRGLARTSNTPGRTQELNFFTPPAGDLYLVDMPGYGYAKAPREMVEAWTRLARAYLRGRPTLKRVFVLVDARHGLKGSDAEIMDLLDETAVSYQLVLTKSDKLKAHEIARVLARTQEAACRRAAAHPEVLATSAAAASGIDALRAAIAGLAAG